jgi:hypothetical protein
MEYTLELSGDHINNVLRHLDLGAHKEVRATMDLIISQVQAQEKAKSQDGVRSVPPPPSASNLPN